MECDCGHTRGIAGDSLCTSGIVFRCWRGKDVRQLRGREKAGTRIEIICAVRNSKRCHIAWNGADDALFNIVQGITGTIMSAAGFGAAQQTVLPNEIVEAVENCGFFESIPLWAVTLIGGLFITVLSFIMIMSVYGRFFRLYLYTAIAPIPLATFAGEPSQNIGVSFIKSYAAVCLEGAVIVLACIIFSLFAASPPVVEADAAAVTMVWSYIGELIFNMLVLVGAVKMADRVVREMMGL